MQTVIVTSDKGIALRAWLYGKGWNRHVGIGPKSKWWSDEAASGAGSG